MAKRRDFVASPSALRQLVKQAMMNALPRRLMFDRGPPSGHRVGLTFDDGPDPTHTPRLLDVLRELRAPATFFVVGGRAAAHPEIVRRIVDEGHALGHHSYTHSDPATTSSGRLHDEIVQTLALLAPLARVTLFRPPHGKLTAPKLLRVWQSRQTVVLWNIDPRDYLYDTAVEVEAFFQLEPLSGGDIVLLHDTVGHAAVALPALVERSRRDGLVFSRVDEMI